MGKIFLVYTVNYRLLHSPYDQLVNVHDVRQWVYSQKYTV